MDQEKCHKKLEESRKKLTEISKQLNHVNRIEGGHGETEWCCIDQVVSSIEELQALISWIAERKGAPEESSVIFQKLQQLSKIRKVLEKTALESQQYLCHFKKGSHPMQELEYHKAFPETKQEMTGNSNTKYPELPVPEAFKTPSAGYLTSSEEYNKSCDAESINMYIKKLCSLPRPLMSQSLGDLARDSDDQHDSLGTAVSEDEGLGEESRRGDSTGPNSLLEINDSAADLLSVDSTHPVTLRYKEPISPTSSIHEPPRWIRDSCCQRNSIELCLATITKLKESLHAKENEILKLRNTTEAKNNVEELQIMVNNLQQNVDDLQSSVFALEKENATLKENLLELEEAENDARLQGQRLEEKLMFLQQKDSHFQVEFAETKHALKLCIEEISLKDAEERELHSQLKFMEVLVQKYEEQLKRLEATQRSAVKKGAPAKLETEKGLEKGTQTYFSQESTVSEMRAKDADSPSQPSEHNAKKDVSVQVEQALADAHMFGVSCEVQTDPLPRPSSVEELSSLFCLGCEVTNSTCEVHGEEKNPSLSAGCPFQMELLKRLRHLLEEDANLQQQLHHVDQINLDLWQKLHNLQFHIGECQKESASKEGVQTTDDSSTETFCSPPNLDADKANLICSDKKYPSIFNNFDCGEEKLKERLSQLEKINSSFSQKLETREKLYIEQERRHENWLKMEDQLTGELKTLGAERDSLFSQVTQLEAEKVQLFAKVTTLETELSVARDKHQTETLRISAERDYMMSELQKTIDELTIREKEYVKQIAKLKSSKNKPDDKDEFERLKSSYVQLQIELVGYRDRLERMRSEFDGQLDSLKQNHNVLESKLLVELDTVREKDLACENKLRSFQARQKELESDLASKEKALEDARLEFKKHMQIAEEEHKSVEAELRKKLSEMEEGTAFATKALKEERFRLERELQDNIDDLRSKEELYKSRIMELESNVSQLHQELHRLTWNLHTKMDSDDNNGSMPFQREHLLNELQELRVREGELREKLDEMEKKEAAYRETLEHADRIVASVERGYKNKIEELEMSERGLKQRVGYLEDVENRLRVALQRERRSSDGRKPDDLVLELAEAEKRENSMKETISTLELSHRTASQRVRELEKNQQQLESQLNDREELASSLEKLQSEQESIRKELTRLRKSENSLQLALHQTESLLEARESEMNAEMSRFNNEKRELEETISQLRTQVRDLNEKSEKHLVEEEPEGETLSGNISFSVNLQPSEENSAADFNANISEDMTLNRLSPENKVKVMEDISSSVPIEVAQEEKTVENQPAIAAIVQEETKDVKNPCKGESTERSKPISNATSEVRGATGTSKAEKEYCEVRMQLEECMMRAMDAMKMEMEHRSMSYSPENIENRRHKHMFLPPYNFHVVQQVGSDTLLVGWEYVETPDLEGFELYLNEQLHETVYAPDRRKAVISGLDLSQPITLSICSVSTSGQISEPQSIHISQKASDGFFFQDDDDDDDDELFDDDTPEKPNRPYSVEW